MHRMHGRICGVWLALFAALLACPCRVPAAEPAPETKSPTSVPECDRPPAISPSATTVPAQAESNLDPLEVFQQVVDRYHRILTYKDSVRMVQTTQRSGEEPRSIETKLTCEITGGKLHVETAASAIRHALGIELPAATSTSMDNARLKYDLWLAPHMALRFADRPLKDLRAGVDEGFTATDVESVTIDNRRMVHLALKSGDGLSEDCAARFDLFINPDSMLIERIDGEQHMPDGANCQTTLHITPLSIENDEVVTQPTT